MTKCPQILTPGKSLRFLKHILYVYNFRMPSINSMCFRTIEESQCGGGGGKFWLVEPKNSGFYKRMHILILKPLEGDEVQVLRLCTSF